MYNTHNIAMAKNHEINVKKLKRVSYKDITKDSDPIIREISNDVPYPLQKDDKRILSQMIDYVRSSQNPEQAKKFNLRPAYGISAIQLGYPKKLIYVRIENEFGGKPEEFALVNPKIIWESENKSYLESGEGCLSVDREHKGYVLRHSQVKIRAIDNFTEREVEIEAKGLTAIVLQHEMDHLLGILFYDRINKLNPFLVPKEALKIK